MIATNFQIPIRGHEAMRGQHIDAAAVLHLCYKLTRIDAITQPIAVVRPVKRARNELRPIVALSQHPQLFPKA